MKLDLIAVGSESEYRNHFDAAYQYLKRESAPVGAEVEGFRILRPDAAALFGALKSSMAAHGIVALLAAPEPEAVSTILKVICSGLRIGSSVDAAVEKQIRSRILPAGQDDPFGRSAAFATFPNGAAVIRNPAGPVQGYALKAEKQMLIVLPAVPSELSALFASGVRPLIARYTGAAVSYGTVRVLEIDSFSVEDQLKAVTAEHPRRHFSFRRDGGDYEILIEATGSTPEEAARQKEAAVAELRKRFGIYLYCIGSRPLEEIVSENLLKNGLTLAVAELAVGGALRRKLAGTGGSDTFLKECVADEDVRGALRLPRGLLNGFENGGARLASAMAVRIRAAGRASIGIGICCRYPEEGGPSGRIRLAVALADRRKVWTRRLELPPGRGPEDAARLAVWQALNVLRLYAVQYPAPLPAGADAAKAAKRLHGPPVRNRKSGSGPAPGTVGSPEGKRKGKMRLSLKRGEKAGKEPAAADPGTSVRGTNLIQRIRRRQFTRGDKIRLGLLAVCAVVFIGCMIYIASVKRESVNNRKLSEELANLYGQTAGSPDGYPEDYIAGFEALYRRNPDVAGWISIDETKLNYAVVQASDNSKYDRTDFDLKKNEHGIPFVDFRVDLKAPSFNSVIYGHNMADGQMFGELLNYKKLSYYRTHPLIRFNSVYRRDLYKIFSVVVCKADDASFNYHNFIDSDSRADRLQYLDKILERSIIRTSVDLKDTDRLLTLSTCDYSFRDPDTNKLIARFVVFARAVRPGESTAVNTDAAILNPNPVMPKEWFEYIKKVQERKEAAELEKEQKAFIELWLTEGEQAEGTVPEQYERALQRSLEAERHLTTSELASGMTPDEILLSIENRKSLFRLFTSDAERDLTANEKVSLCSERASALAPYFSDGELRQIGTWSVLQSRYRIIRSDPDVLRYLTIEDIKDTTKSDNTQIELLNRRKAEAAKYLTQAEIGACGSWEELSARTESAKTARAALEAEALRLGIRQEEIDKMSLADLRAAVDRKKNQQEISRLIAEIRELNPDAAGPDGKPLQDLSLEELQGVLTALQEEKEKAGLIETLKTEYLVPEEELENMTLDQLREKKAQLDRNRAERDALIREIRTKYPQGKTEEDLKKMTLEELRAYKATLEAQQPGTPPEPSPGTPPEPPPETPPESPPETPPESPPETPPESVPSQSDDAPTGQ